MEKSIPNKKLRHNKPRVEFDHSSLNLNKLFIVFEEKGKKNISNNL
jgi:hypothetical protein